MSNILRSMFLDNQPDKNDHISFESYNLEGEILNITDSYNELTESFESLDRLQEIDDGLSKLLSISLDAIEVGGLNSREAAILGLCSEILLKPTEIDNIILSPSAFSLEALPSTANTVEKQKSVLEKTWEAISKVITFIRDKIKQFFGKLFSFTKSSLDKNNAMLADLEKLKGKSVPDDKKTIKFSASNLLSADQKQSDLLTNISDLQKLNSIFLTNNKTVLLVKDMVTDFKKEALDIDDIKDPLMTALAMILVSSFRKYFSIKNIKSSTDTPDSMKEKDMIVVKYGHLPGNKALYAYTSDDDAKLLSHGRFKLGPFKDKNSVGKIEFNVGSVDEIKEILMASKSILETINNAKNNAKLSEEVSALILETGKVVKDRWSNLKEKKVKAFGYRTMYLQVLKTLGKMCATTSTELSGLSAKVAVSLMGLAGSMMKVYN